VLAFRKAADGGTVGDLVLRTVPVAHPVEAYAVRVEHGGASLVYSGDTGPSADLVELAEAADVLLCEAAWPHVVQLRARDEPPAGSIRADRRASTRRSGVGRLLLTHIPAWCDPAAPTWRRRRSTGRSRWSPIHYDPDQAQPPTPERRGGTGVPIQITAGDHETGQRPGCP
jgi:ribonuclease BN (tRNA processing enzyme)